MKELAIAGSFFFCIKHQSSTNTMHRLMKCRKEESSVRKAHLASLGFLIILAIAAVTGNHGRWTGGEEAASAAALQDFAWMAPAKKQKKQAIHPSRLSANDLKLMANAVYGEARGEPYVGQVAIAAVILNRMKSPSFPDTPAGVIFEPRAFTAVSDGQIWLTPNESAKKAVRDALSGWDPTGGCCYYFNPATATSKWIWSRPQVKRIGKHIFCR
jgi:N-acetylmuramoyl-L-alanine amidase